MTRGRWVLAAGLACLLMQGCFGHMPTMTETRVETAALDVMEAKHRARQPDGPLTLTMALELAMCNNPDVLLQRREEAISDEAKRTAMLRALPQVNVDGEWSERTPENASVSLNTITREEDDEASISSPRTSMTTTVGMLWNALDFGVSYFGAKQARDRSKIAAQRLRRVRQNLALEVREAYWRAQIARRAWNASKRVLAGIEERREVIKKQEADQAIAVSDALFARKRLMNLQLRLERYEDQYERALLTLKRLLNLAPVDSLTLAEDELPAFRGDDAFADIADLERKAFLQRPELYENDLRHSISLAEVRIATIRLFPSPSMFFNLDWDSNRFLTHSEWATVGARASWNLLSIPERVGTVREARLRRELAQDQRLAMHVGILAQVHLAILDRFQSMRRFTRARRFAAIQKQLVENLRAQVEDGRASTAVLLNEEAESVVVGADYDEARLAVLLAEARIDNSVGVDPLTDDCSLPLDAETPLFTTAPEPELEEPLVDPAAPDPVAPDASGTTDGPASESSRRSTTSATVARDDPRTLWNEAWLAARAADPDRLLERALEPAESVPDLPVDAEAAALFAERPLPTPGASQGHTAIRAGTEAESKSAPAGGPTAEAWTASTEDALATTKGREAGARDAPRYPSPLSTPMPMGRTRRDPLPPALVVAELPPLPGGEGIEPGAPMIAAARTAHTGSTEEAAHAEHAAHAPAHAPDEAPLDRASRELALARTEAAAGDASQDRIGVDPAAGDANAGLFDPIAPELRVDPRTSSATGVAAKDARDSQAAASGPALGSIHAVESRLFVEDDSQTRRPAPKPKPDSVVVNAASAGPMPGGDPASGAYADLAQAVERFAPPSPHATGPTGPAGSADAADPTDARGPDRSEAMAQGIAKAMVAEEMAALGLLAGDIATRAPTGDPAATASTPSEAKPSQAPEMAAMGAPAAKPGDALPTTAVVLEDDLLGLAEPTLRRAETDGLPLPPRAVGETGETLIETPKPQAHAPRGPGLPRPPRAAPPISLSSPGTTASVGAPAAVTNTATGLRKEPHAKGGAAPLPEIDDLGRPLPKPPAATRATSPMAADAMPKPAHDANRVVALPMPDLGAPSLPGGLDVGQVDIAPRAQRASSSASARVGRANRPAAMDGSASAAEVLAEVAARPAPMALDIEGTAEARPAGPEPTPGRASYRIATQRARTGRRSPRQMESLVAVELLDPLPGESNTR